MASRLNWALTLEPAICRLLQKPHAADKFLLRALFPNANAIDFDHE